MSTAAKISIQIDAQTATLQKGFGEARAAIQKLDAGMSSNVAMGMAKFTAGLTVIRAGFAAAQGAIGSFMSAMDEMGKMDEFASRLGMSADALTVLGYAAEQSGASQETMNAALQKMQNLIGEATAGSKEAAAAFAAIGLSVSSLQTLKPDQQFSIIAERIKDIGSASERTKVILDIFGKSGGELINTLALGAEGLEAYGKEAEAMGILLGNARGDVESLGDTMNKVKRTWGGAVQQMVITTTPFLEIVGGAIAKVLAQFNAFNNKIKITPIVGPSANVAARQAAEAAMATTAAKEAEAALKKMTERGNNLTESMRTPMEVYRDSLAELNKLVQKGVITWSTYTRAAKKAMQDVIATRKEISDFKTPGIGAVTRGSSAGFSALQEAQRDKQDADRRHREILAWYARIESAVRGSTVILSPVNL